MPLKKHLGLKKTEDVELCHIKLDLFFVLFFSRIQPKEFILQNTLGIKQLTLALVRNHSPKCH